MEPNKITIEYASSPEAANYFASLATGDRFSFKIEGRIDSNEGGMFEGSVVKVHIPKQKGDGTEGGKPTPVNLVLGGSDSTLTEPSTPSSRTYDS